MQFEFLEFLLFLVAMVLTVIFTPWVRRLALKVGAYVDVQRERRERDIHKDITPTMGGLAIFLSFFITSFFAIGINKSLIGIILGSLVILTAGIIDDICELSPLKKLFWQLASAIILIIFGFYPSVITNPFGAEPIYLDKINLSFALFGKSLIIPIFSIIFTILWVMILENAINFLDGLDGLASGVSGIAALVLFGIAAESIILTKPQTAIMALIFAGAIFGFLPHNFYPARIFLGDTGSMFLGYMLAVISLLKAAKIPTAIIVLGFPILDLVWAIVRRSFKGKLPINADRGHFHHLLVDIGLSQPQAVIILYIICGTFGLASLFLKETYQSKLMLAFIFGLMLFTAAIFIIYATIKRNNKKR